MRRGPGSSSQRRSASRAWDRRPGVQRRCGEQVEQRRVVARLEVRSDLEDERDLTLGSDPGERLVDALVDALLRLRRCLGVVGAGEQLGLAALDRGGDRGAVRGDDRVDLAPQLVGGLLELRHLVAAEGVGIGERGLDRLVAARRQVAEVAAVGRQERRAVVVDRPLRSVEERLDRVDEVLLGFEQVVAEVEVVEVPVVGLADGLLQETDGAAELLDERVLASR